jgi:hypothetical protein
MEDNYSLYYKRAEKHLSEYRVEDVTPHLLDIIVSVMMHRDGARKGGSTVAAICDNDLFGVVGRADSVVMQHLKVIVAAHLYAHIQQLQYV